MEYNQFLRNKFIRIQPVGLDVDRSFINPLAFDFQKDVIRWALHKGRCAIFADTGMGKTLMQLEWARLLGGRVLIVAPLSVARQTVREAGKFGIPIVYQRSGMSDEEIQSDGIIITNYEKIENFNPEHFDGVVLDESSILKAVSGKTRRTLTDMFSKTKYRLCCTATPAPNDYTELGNHAEFLGVCTEAEMRAMFFINANKEHTYEIDGKAYRRKGSNNAGTEWRLKHPAEKPFFQWLSSWAMSITKPSDLGYNDDGYNLPELRVNPDFTRTSATTSGKLLFDGLHGLQDRADIRRKVMDARLERLKEIITPDEQWIVWCGLDAESAAVHSAIYGSVEVKGSDEPEGKAQAFEDFQDGKYNVLITKPRIGGFGMNFQNAHKMIFFGMSDSWEAYYQCVRRQWRYGQTKPVDVWLLLSEQENEIYLNVMRKDAMARRLRGELIANIAEYERRELDMDETSITVSANEKVTRQSGMWTAMRGDSCERLREIGDCAVDLSVYSPPFADLYTYTDSPRDLGNSRDWKEFFGHYKYIIREVLRVTKPGRITCVHTSEIPAMQERDGYIGVKDFPGEVIRAYEAEGWIYSGRALVQKNPQAQAIRVHASGLAFAQLARDSSRIRPALVDHVLIFRKPGDNVTPITPVKNGEMDNETWIEWANGIWIGIRETDTLQFTAARDGDDEKHICPLQLGTIERCVKLYSNPGETVLSPFMGIGSEGYQAVKLGRKFIGCELKDSYYEIAVKNLERAEYQQNTPDLFSFAGLQI